MATLPVSEDGAREDAPAKKRLVEHSLQLDVHKPMRLGIIREGAHDTGGIEWRNLVTGTVVGECRYRVDCRRTDAPAMGIKYQLPHRDRMMSMIHLTPRGRTMAGCDGGSFAPSKPPQAAGVRAGQGSCSWPPPGRSVRRMSEPIGSLWLLNT